MQRKSNLVGTSKAHRGNKIIHLKGRERTKRRWSGRGTLVGSWKLSSSESKIIAMLMWSQETHFLSNKMVEMLALSLSPYLQGHPSAHRSLLVCKLGFCREIEQEHTGRRRNRAY